MKEEEIKSLTPMIHKIINKRYSWFVGKNKDLRHDLYAVSVLKMIEAYPHFDSSKSKLSTYMYFIVSREMLKFICEWNGYEGGKNKYKPRVKDVSIQALEQMEGNEGLAEGRNHYLTYDDKEFDSFELIQVMKEILTDKEFMVITSKYFQGIELKDLAPVLKITKAGVSKIHTRALEKLKNQLKCYNWEL